MIVASVIVALFFLFALIEFCAISDVRVEIGAGRHYPNPITSLLCAWKIGWFGETRIGFRFEPSCFEYSDYDQDPDAYDGAHGKLIGRATKFPYLDPRKGSTRFFWRRIPDGSAIEVRLVRETADGIDRGDLYGPPSAVVTPDDPEVWLPFPDVFGRPTGPYSHGAEPLREPIAYQIL